MTHQVAALLVAALPRLAVALTLPPERRPRYADWVAALFLAGVFVTKPLGGALRGQLADDPGAHAAALTAAATLLLHVPLDAPPTGLQPPSTHAGMPAMFAYFYGVLSGKAEAAAVWAAHSPHRRRLASQLARVHARLPALLRLIADSPAVLMPLFGELTGGNKDQLLVAAAGSLSHPLVLLFGAPSGVLPGGELPPTAPIRSLTGVAEWATAVAAGLRCVPLLAAVRPPAAAHPDAQAHNAAGFACRFASAASLFCIAARRSSEDVQRRTAGEAAAAAAARAAIWQLHTTACR